MSSSEAELWARSGAMALTGRADGPPLHCAGAPATSVQRALDRLAAAGVAELPDIGLLSERAALLGYQRSAPFSANGSCCLLPCLDGWFALSLPRESDVDLVPALTQLPADPDPWQTVRAWLRTVSGSEAAARATLLGLAATGVPATPPTPDRLPIVVTEGGPRHPVDQPVVVDFSSLWAGPLCSHLLSLAGARVIKVESRTRPDGSRQTPDFFARLHEGHEFGTLDFDADRNQLHSLVASADVVVEASRPRALRQLGIDAMEHVARGAIWISITAYGRIGANSMRVGFGDDVAAGAGLVAWNDGVPHPAGDALADPLTGVTAAAAAVEALALPSGRLLDISMHDVALEAARMT